MEQNECARLETRDGQPVSLLGVKLSGELRGLMFEASVEQRFCNPSDSNVEVVYSFPLPWKAVLLGVDVLLGSKHLTGAVVEKTESEARYEEALSDGNAAIMLEKNCDHSYSLSLGNLTAGEQCTITLRYAQILQFEQRGLRLLIPTVIAPRYGDAEQDGGLLLHQTPHHSLLVDHPFALELRLHGDLAQARVASPSHPIRVAHGDAEVGAVLTVSLARQASLDRDFVLVVDQLARDSVVIAARDGIEPSAVAIMASFCPHIAAPEQASTAVKILVDCSGSMAGDSIDAAKRALQAIVQQLGARDRFSLSRFGSSVEHRSRGLWKATETTQLAAQRWVGALEANLGGTEMEAALTSTFALAHTVSTDVLLVTDGEISAIDSTIASAKDAGHRLFIVGIGSSPAEIHLRRMAEATGGACDFVAPGEAVEPAVLRMFVRLRSPRLSGLRLEWPEGTVPGWGAPLPTSVFDGDTLTAFAMLPQLPSGVVRLLGHPSGDVTKNPIEIGAVHLTDRPETVETISRMAASALLHSMSIEETQPEIDTMQIAVDYQLVTDQTNFLLVHERADDAKATDMPKLRKIKQMVPAGYGGLGSVIFARRGALGVRRADGDYSGMSIPAVCRNAKTSTSLSPSDTMDELEIPAFLRRSTDAIPVNLSKRAQIMNRQDSRYWARSEHYVGLTPLGICEWLQITPVSRWPTTYAGLRLIGLGEWLIDWLELTVAVRNGTAQAERKVVCAFLCVMSKKQAFGLLSQPQVMRVDASLLAEIASESMATSGDARFEMVEAMAGALKGTTVDEWPEQIFALG